MLRKLICSFSFVLVLGLVGYVQAANVTWIDAGLDQFWSTTENWDTGTLPTFFDRACVNMVPGPIIANEGAVAYELRLADGDDGELTVDGGTLTTTRWIDSAWSIGRESTINMKSGTIHSGRGIMVAKNGLGTFNITGGTVIVDDDFRIASKPTAIGHANLDGGTITTNNFTMRETEGSVGTMNISTGTLIINGDKLSLVQGYIDNGWITAYNGKGTLHLDYNVTNEGKTTLKATHMLNPNPADDGLVGPGEVELSWTLPDPCVPGQPVPVDVYFTDNLKLLEEFTDPAAIQVVSKQNVTSVVVRTQLKTRYYWAVDTYVGSPEDPIFGSIFSFFVDNLPPKVDAGKDIVTYLANGVRAGNLNATVTDDGALSPYTVQWTVVSEPSAGAAVIEAAAVEDTGINLTAVGEYVLQLEAFDGEYTGSDTVTIYVYNDSCETARSVPDYVPLVGDINGDCKVDDVDMALLQENWLKDNSSTEEWFTIE